MKFSLKKWMLLLLLFHIPLVSSPGFSFKPGKILGNIFKGDPLNIGGGGTAAADRLDGVLTKHMASLSKMQEQFTKDNLKLVSEFHKGNAQNLELFHKNNQILVSEFGNIVGSFTESLHEGFRDNINQLEIRTTSTLETASKKLSYRVNLSILFFVFALYVFVLILLLYAYYLYVIKSRKNIRDLLLSAQFLKMLGVGLLVSILFYGGLQYFKFEDIKERMSLANEYFKNGRYSDAYVEAATLRQLVKNKGKVKEADFLFDKYYKALELFEGPLWISQSTNLERTNKEFLNMLEYKLDPDVLTMKAYFNWTRADNKANRHLAHILAEKALETDDFALRNYAIDIINGQNSLFSEVKENLSNLIEDSDRISSMLDIDINAYSTPDKKYTKNLSSIYGTSNIEQQILNRLYLFKNKTAALYIDMLKEFRNIDMQHNKANEIIKEFNNLVTYVKTLSPNRKEFFLSNENLINTNILLQALSIKVFSKPLGLRALNNIPSTITETKEIEGEVLVMKNYRGIFKNIARAMNSISSAHLKAVNKTIADVNIPNPEKAKVDLVFEDFNSWVKTYNEALDMEMNDYIKGIYKFNKLQRNLEIDKGLDLVKGIYYANRKEALDLTTQEYLTFCTLLNELGLLPFKDQIRDTEKNKEKLQNFILQKDNLNALSLLEI